MKKLPLLVTAAAVVVMLAGCVGSPVVPSGSPTPSATVTPTTSATPTPAARADFGFTYFENADLGSTFDQMSTQLGRPVAGITECPWYGPVDATDPHITYAFLDSRDASVGTTFFYSLAYPGVTTYPRNAEHVGLGSTQAELLAAYPTAVVGSTHDLGAGDIATVTVQDPSSPAKYVFGFNGDTGTVDLLQWGSAPGTQWSHLCEGF
ncbi:MAG: hypothetical protein ABI632_06865 [Pseudolysinimonas sp.]